MRSQDFVHVSMKNEESDFTCANSKNCSRFRVTVAKKRKTLSLCPHEHIAMLVSGRKLEEADHEASQDEGENKASDDDNDFKVDFSDMNMRRIEEMIMEKNKSGDWSKVYQVRQCNK